MGTVMPGTVTVAGQPVRAAGGPWQLGVATIRAASAVLYSPQRVSTRVGNAWVPVPSGGSG